VAFWRRTLLQLDDCLYALQPSIPHLTRSSLHRCLQRHGISRLPDIEGDKPKQQKFKRYPIGSSVEHTLRVHHTTLEGAPPVNVLKCHWTFPHTASALWKVRLKPIHLRFTQKIKIAHSIPHLWDFETCSHSSIKWINGSWVKSDFCQINGCAPF